MPCTREYTEMGNRGGFICGDERMQGVGAITGAEETDERCRELGH
jgi:hypothetical protein